MLRHLPRVGAAQPVADHHVEVAVVRQLGDDVGADEAGPAGDEDRSGGSWPASGALADGGGGGMAVDEVGEPHLAALALHLVVPTTASTV